MVDDNALRKVFRRHLRSLNKQQITLLGHLTDAMTQSLVAEMSDADVVATVDVLREIIRDAHNLAAQMVKQEAQTLKH